MGTSLSITAIAFQIYYINAYPRTLQDLRSGSSTLGIDKFNEEAIIPQSRSLLMDVHNSDSNASIAQASTFETISVKQFVDTFNANDTEFEAFGALFTQQYSEFLNDANHLDTIHPLQAKYKELKFSKSMRRFVQQIIEGNIPFEEENELVDLRTFLADVIFSNDLHVLQQLSLSEMLMITLQQVCRDMMLNEPNEIIAWIYMELMKDARAYNILPGDQELADASYRSLNDKYSEIDAFGTGVVILPSDSEILSISTWNYRSTQQFMVYAFSLENLSETWENKYPYLKFANTLKFKYLYKILSDGEYDLSNLGIRDPEAARDDTERIQINQGHQAAEYFQNVLIDYFYAQKDNITHPEGLGFQLKNMLTKNNAEQSLVMRENRRLGLLSTEFVQFYMG